MNFKTARELLILCESGGHTIGEVMLIRETQYLEHSDEEFRKSIDKTLRIMREAVESALTKELKTMGGLIGGEARLIERRAQSGDTVCGRVMGKAVSYAMGVLETNASMGLVVAAPTAGSSGVLPGVLLALSEEKGYTDEQLHMALCNAAAIGYLITHNATVSGAKGGCQAEVGAASAMAASAATELSGGSAKQCLAAAATAIINLLGLVCDPVGGLVEVPCQSRNAIGASNALICAEIALSNACTDIPFDEVVAAMYSVGKALPHELRETALGGVAACPSCKL